MSDNPKYTHAYVQYIADKEKEIVEVSQISKVSQLKEGKTVKVKWYNKKSGFHEHHQAYIHLLGTSEMDVEEQIEECDRNNIRLKLPSTKALTYAESDENDEDAQNQKMLKEKVALAKTTTNREILNQKQKAIMENRETLRMDDVAGNEDFVESRNVEGEKILDIDDRQAKGKERKEDNNVNNNPGPSKPSEGNEPERKKKKLAKYDTHKDQTYIGGGIFLPTEEWDNISAISSNGSFIISLATAIWGNELKDMCLNEKRAKARTEGQVRKAIPLKMIKAMEDVYTDRLKKRGAKGENKLKTLVSKVRRTLTNHISDLNKNRGVRRNIEEDAEDDEDGVVYIDE